MKFAFRLKYRFFNAFREVFVHHHGSLEFRAKVFALVISANESADENLLEELYKLVQDIGMNIYNDDASRANLLMLTTSEIVEKVQTKNKLDIDKLAYNIQKELKLVPRYAAKIDMKLLKPLIVLTRDEDTIHYQERILEFLSNLKNEHLERN